MKTIRGFIFLFLLIGALLALASCDFDLGGLLPVGTTTAATTEAPVTTAPVTTEAPVTTAAPVTTEPPVTTAPVTTLDTLTALSPYITLSREDYYGLSVSIPGKSTVSDADVSKYIDSLLAKVAPYKEITEGELREGDAAHIFYRGEIFENGSWVEFVGGSNQTTMNAQRLVIGSGSFIPGFEEGLVGLSLDATSLKLSTDLSRVLGGDGLSVAYVTYKVSYGGASRGSFSDRVDLSAESGRYVGSALLADLAGKATGEVLPGPYTVSFDITGDLVPEELTLTDVEITCVATEEESFCLNVTFPESYHSTELAGKEARFYVIVMKVERPEIPALTHDLILDTFGVKPEQLAPFVPADSTLTAEEQIVAAFPLFVRDMLTKEREAEIRDAVIMAFWRRMDAIVPKAYPEALLTTLLAEVREQLEMEYRQYASQYGSSLSLEEFVLAYYTLPEGVTDFDGFVSHFGKARARQKMILHYIAAAEGWELDERERTEGYETYMQELIDFYRDYYGGMITVTKEDLIEIGYTEEYVCEQLLFDKVDNAIFETMREHIVFEDE